MTQRLKNKLWLFLFCCGGAAFLCLNFVHFVQAQGYPFLIKGSKCTATNCHDCISNWVDDTTCPADPDTGVRYRCRVGKSMNSVDLVAKKCERTGKATDNCQPWGVTTDGAPSSCNMTVWNCGCVNIINKECDNIGVACTCTGPNNGIASVTGSYPCKE